MADTRAEGGDAVTTPKPTRKARTSPTESHAVEAPKTRKPRAKAAPRKRAAASESTPVETVAKTVRKRAAVAKPAVKRVVRKVEDKASKAGETASRKRVALGAVALAAAAGVAAVVSRKKIAKVTTEAIDAVTGNDAKSSGTPTRSAD